MAIIIPSKNIYEMNNPKIRDNIVDNVSVEQTIVKPNNEYEAPIYNEDIANLSLKLQETTNEDLQETWQINTNAYLFTGACAYVGYNSQKYHEQKVYIPKLKDNSFINKLLLGVDDNGNQNIKTTFVGTKNKGTTSGTWYGNFITSGTNELIVTKGEINYSQPTETKTDERYDIPKEIYYTYQSENRGNPTAKANLIDIGNLSTVSFDEEIKDGIEYYTLQLKILCGIRIVYMGGYDDGMQGTISNCPFVMSGSYEEYIPTNIEITVYGDTIGIDLTDGSVTYGSGKHPHSLNANELLQDSAKVGNALLTKHLADNVLTQYAKCKETATLLCDINEYYHYGSDEKAITTNGKVHYPIENITVSDNVVSIPNPFKNDITVIAKVYSPNVSETISKVIKSGETQATFDYGVDKVQEAYFDLPMTFKLHDEVIPMVFGADGQDKPMSKYQDGSPKVFEVTGSNIIYDGAVWQELTLLEKKQEIT